MQVLHNLHGHSNGTQFFIFDLKYSKLSDCFNSTGIKFHIFDNDLVPWYTECTWPFSKVSFFRRLKELVGDEWVLKFSVAKTCKFMWCIETELLLSSSSWNVDVLSWYVILRAFSCRESNFIFKTSTAEHQN